MAASARSLVIATAGALAAGALIYFVAFQEGGKPAAGTGGPNATDTPKKSSEPAPTVATAEAAKVDDRKNVGQAVSVGRGGVEGVVRDEGGKQVPGATIEFRKAPSMFTLGKAAPEPVEKAAAYSGKSGVDGVFKVDVPPGEGWVLIATHPDYARVEHLSISVPSDSYLAFPVTMRTGVRLYGRVTDADSNRPIEGARVVLDGAPVQSGFQQAMVERREATTDTSGQFKFENVREGRHAISVRAKGFGTRDNGNVNVSGTGVERSHREDFRLGQGRSISGRVVDLNGQGVARARVEAFTGGIGGSSGESTTSDAGEFVVADLEENRFFLNASADGYGTGHPEPQPVAAGSVDLVITLTAKGSVQGVVRDRSSGEPVSRFSVEIRRSMPKTIFAPREIGPIPFDSKDGTFEIKGVDPGSEHIAVIASDGFANGTSDRFSVQPNQVTRGVEVLVSAGGGVRGQVVDGKTGKPVSGATVRTREKDWTDKSGVPIFGALLEGVPSNVTDRTVITDSDGRFEVGHIEVGAVQLEVKHPSYVTAMQRDVAITEGKTIDLASIRLLSGASVKGVVFGPDGGPAANAEVSIRTQGPLGPGASMVGRTIRTDAQGKYLIRNLPPGSYTLTANGGGPGDAPDNPFTKALNAQKTKQDVTLNDGSEVEVSLYLPSN